jgi:phage repressor protein C with HTH and peptisase S24 domain
LQANLSMNARWEKGSIEGMANLSNRIRQVRKQARLSQEKFADALNEIEGVNVTRGAVCNWELAGGISRANLAAISRRFNVDLNWLERGIGIEPRKPDNVPTTKEIVSGGRQLISTSRDYVVNAKIGAALAGYTRVPLRGHGMGGKHGALIFNADENLGEIEAPPKLHGVPDAYAVYVIGDSMEDRFRHGEVVFVHPYEPIKKDDDVVVQIQNGEGAPVVGYIKRFISRTDTTLKVAQLHPKKVLTFGMATVLAIHKIVMAGSL